MASNLGTVFVELSLDDKVYKQKLGEVLTSTETTAKGIETSWKALGTKSDAVFNSQRLAAENAYTLIKNAATSTANDIARAQEASSAKVTSINEQQFGKQTSLLDSLKSNYVAASIAIVGAWALVNKAVSYMDEAGKALQIESSFRIMSEAAGINSGKLIESMKAATKETVDDSDLMQKAVKLMLLDFDATQIEEFSSVVITASQFAGKTVSETFDALGDAIANRTPKALRALGALAPEQMTIFKEAVTAGASSADILALAVANLELKQLQLQGTQDGASISLQRFHAQVKETGETLGKVLIVGMREAYAVFQAFGVASLEVSSSIYKILEARNAFAAFVHFGDAKKEYEESSKAFAKMAADDKAAAESLRVKMIENFTLTSAAGAKATGEALAGGKAKVASALTVLGSYKDNTQAVKNAAAAEKKAAEEAVKLLDEKYKQEMKVLIDTASAEDKMRKDGEEGARISTASIKKMEDDLWQARSKIITDTDKAEADLMKDIDEGVKVTMASIKKQGEDRGAAEREIYKDLRGYEDQYYAASQVLIDAQAEKYRMLGVSEVAISAWVAAETLKEDIKKAESGDDFMAGVNAGYLRMKENAMTLGKAGSAIFTEFATSSKTALSTMLFDSFKTGTFDAQAVWTTFTDSMLKKFTDVMAQMVVEAAANAVELTFNAVVSGDWSQVLGLVNKIWGAAGTVYDWASGSGSSGLEELGQYAEGGPVPGGAPVWVGERGKELLFPSAPGYVLDHEKSQVYAARNGGYIPGYADGGEVYARTGSRPYAGLPPLTYSEHAEGMEYQGATWLTPESIKQVWSVLSNAGAKPPTNGREPSQNELNAYNAIVAGVGVDQYGWMALGAGQSYPYPEGTLRNILTGYLAPAGTPTSSNLIGQPPIEKAGIGFVQSLGEMVSSIPVLGNITDAIDKLAYQTGGFTGLAGEYSPFGLDVGISQDEYKEYTHLAGIIAATIGAGSAAGAAGAGSTAGMTAGEIAAGVGAKAGAATTLGVTGGWVTTFGAAVESWILNYAAGLPANIAKGQAKGLISSLLNKAFGGGEGSASLSFEGATGDMSWLTDAMNGIAPKTDTFAFSARNGLDNVPYDNFPAVLHKGERVQTAEQAKGGDSDILYILAKNSSKILRILDRWDGDGQPSVRVV